MLRPCGSRSSSHSSSGLSAATRTLPRRRDRARRPATFVSRLGSGRLHEAVRLVVACPTVVVLVTSRARRSTGSRSSRINSSFGSRWMHQGPPSGSRVGTTTSATNPATRTYTWGVAPGARASTRFAWALRGQGRRCRTRSVSSKRADLSHSKALVPGWPRKPRRPRSSPHATRSRSAGRSTRLPEVVERVGAEGAHDASVAGSCDPPALPALTRTWRPGSSRPRRRRRSPCEVFRAPGRFSFEASEVLQSPGVFWGPLTIRGEGRER